jgi:outer membrane receptor protein involved in Fe transport
VLVNSTVTWISPSEKFRLSLWGTNLTNKRYDLYETPTGTGTYHSIAAPWFAGVRAEMKF